MKRASADAVRRATKKRAASVTASAASATMSAPTSATRGAASREDALLYDILDPNRRVDPQFHRIHRRHDRRSSVQWTDDRGVFTDSVTLRQPEGREQNILSSAPTSKT